AGRQEYRAWDRTVGIAGAGFLDDMIHAVNLIMPRAAMPVVVASEVKNASALEVQGNVAILSELVKEVSRIGAFVAPAPIVSATHVSARANPLVRPSVPHPVGIEPHGDYWRLGGAIQ